VEDVSAEVRDFAEKVHASPERLEEIETGWRLWTG